MQNYVEQKNVRSTNIDTFLYSGIIVTVRFYEQLSGGLSSATSQAAIQLLSTF